MEIKLFYSQIGYLGGLSLELIIIIVIMHDRSLLGIIPEFRLLFRRAASLKHTLNFEILLFNIKICEICQNIDMFNIVFFTIQSKASRVLPYKMVNSVSLPNFLGTQGL